MNATHKYGSMRTRRPIRQTFLIWFLTMSLIPVGGVAVFSYKNSSIVAQDTALSRLKNESRLKLRFVHTWFNYRLMDLMTQSASRLNVTLLSELHHGLVTQSKPLNQYINSPQWTETADQHRQRLMTVLNRYDYIYDLLIIDKQGNILFNLTHKNDLGENLLNGDYLKHTKLAEHIRPTLESGRLMFSGIERYAPSNNQITGFLGAPLISDSGENIGAFVIQLKIDQVFGFLQTNHSEDSSKRHYIVNKKGELRTPINQDWDEVLNRQIQLAQVLDASQTRRRKQATREKTIGPFGQEVLRVAQPITLLNKKWIIINEIDKTEVLAEAHAAVKIVIALVFITGGVVIVLTYILANQLASPIVKLSKASMELAKGTINKKVELKQNNEIGDLADSFNYMAHKLTHNTEELILAKEAAEEAAKTKSEFLASMSHEIRTPMNGVLGMLGIVLRTELSTDQKHRIEVAQGSAQSLLTLINDILDFSKVDAGKMELELLDFDLRKMLGELVEAMGLQAQGKNLELILDTTKIEESHVKGDPGRLRQIITNIVGNAIKFTEEGEIIIRVTLETSVEENTWILNCDVQDTGIGIPEEKIATIFNSFSQVDASTTRQFGGTGLGLAIVEKLCVLMDGNVSVTSTPGQGSCFSIQVKLEKSDASQQVLPHTDISKLTILIVDDNAVNREVLHTQLTHWGAKIYEADSAISALALCKQHYQDTSLPFFDIGLIDMQMPDIDGATLGTQLKNDERFRNMKLVMMTSMGQQEDSHYFRDLGFSAYFPKPVTTSDLFAALSVISNDEFSIKENEKIITSEYLRNLKTYDTEEINKQCNWDETTRVLLVEDNQVNQMVATDILNDQCIYVDIANNGVEAIKILSDTPTNLPYELILMDCQMPEMDGFETTRRIRNGDTGKAHQSTPIIALTANAMSGDKQRCLDAGMSDYISKPIDPDLLFNKMAKWINGLTIARNHQNVYPDNQELQKQEKDQQDELQHWDKDALKQRVGGKEERMKKLARLFLSGESSRKVSRIIDAGKIGDISAIRELAHGLKGAAGNLGAIALQQQAFIIENAAKENNIDIVRQAIPKLNHEYEAFRETLERYLNE